MRIAQLARKIEITASQLETYLKKNHNISEFTGPNMKLDDEVVEAVKAAFPVVAKKKEVEVLQHETIEIQEKVIVYEEEFEVEEVLSENNVKEEVIAGIEDKKIEVEQEVEVAPEVKEEVEEIKEEEVKQVQANTPIINEVLLEETEIIERTEPVSEEAQDVLNRLDPNDGIIKSPKVELEGLKVMGKIDLPQDKIVEEVVLTEEEIAEKEKIEEEAKAAKEKKKEKKKPNFMEEKRKKEEIRLKAEKKKKDAQKIKEQKEAKRAHYEKQVANKPKPAAKKKVAKKVSEDQKFELKKNEYNDSLFGRFKKWLNGE